MKISNPTLYGTNGGVGSILTTVSYVSSYVSGQLSTVSGNLNTKIETVSSSLSGYAELSNGKISPSALPDLAITSVRSVSSQVDFFNTIYKYTSGDLANYLGTPVSSYTGITAEQASLAVKYYVKAEDAELPGYFQDGDMLIISPASGQVLNEYILGTWIIQDGSAQQEVSDFSAIKMYIPRGDINNISISGVEYSADPNGTIDLTAPFNVITGTISAVSGELQTNITTVSDELQTNITTVSGDLNTAITGVAAELAAVSDDLKTVSDIVDVVDVVANKEIFLSSTASSNMYGYTYTPSTGAVSDDFAQIYGNLLDALSANIIEFKLQITEYNNYLPTVTCVYEAEIKEQNAWGAYNLIYPEVKIINNTTTISVITTTDSLTNKKWKVYFTIPATVYKAETTPQS